MKETRYSPAPKQPYYLHDCRINEMHLENDNLTLTFEDGYTGLDGAYVQGQIVVEGIDPDFCEVVILGRGIKTGGFRGERLTIEEFVRKYEGFHIEVINEYYGWHRLQYSGCLWMPDRAPKDIMLSLGYFKGDVVYYTEE